MFSRVVTQFDEISRRLKAHGAKLTGRSMGIAVHVICISCISMSVLEAIFIQMKLHRNERYLNPWLVYEEQTRRAREILPVIENEVLRNVVLLTVFLVHTISNRFYYLTIGHMGYAVLMVFCLAIGELYEALNAIVPKEFLSQHEINEKISLYTELRRFTMDASETVGTLMAWGIIGHLPFNAYAVTDLLSSDIMVQISYAIHIAAYLGVLYAGGKVHSQINLCMDKIACDDLVLQDVSLQVKVGLLQQQARWEGIRAGRYFLLTYGFLANIMGIILTYAILMVPHQPTHT